MTQLAVVHRRRLRHPLLSVACAATALAFAAASPVAQAAVIQTPYCLVCAVNNMPAAGDELVIRGFVVRFGTDNLVSPGVLTNRAYSLTSAYNLLVTGGLNNHGRWTNTGALTVAGPGRTAWVNHDLFTNASSGTVWLFSDMDNRAGRLVNNGSIQVQGGEVFNRGGATITNNASLALVDGGMTNLANGVFNNFGEVRGKAFGSRLNNQGVVNNQAGSMRVALFTNSGQVNNSAAATLAVGNSLINETGGRLVNRGLIEVGVDARLALNQGSAYDFQGGRLNIGALGRLQLNRDFTIGDAQGGQVTLGAMGRIENAATLRLTGAQTTLGDIDNAGTVVNQGDWQHLGMLIGSGTLNNSGRLTAEGVVRTGAFTQQAGQMVVVGDVGLGQAAVEQGRIDVEAGARLSADTLTLNGGLVARGGSTLRMGSLYIDEQGWLDLANASVVVTGDVIDGSQVTDGWLTRQATLRFEGAGLHRFGIGLGSHDWGTLALDAAGSYEFFGGDALTVGVLDLAGGDLSLLSAIYSDATIYYDASLAANAYLNGQRYSFGQGQGQLVALNASPVMPAAPMARSVPASIGFSAMAVTPVPEAEHGAMVLAGLAVLGLRWRRLQARERARAA